MALDDELNRDRGASNQRNSAGVSAGKREGESAAARAVGGEAGVLDTWKAIAGYLGVSVRTAQHWEDTQGLPVHGLRGERARVWVLSKELEAWRRGYSAGLPPEPAGRWVKWAVGAACLVAVAIGAAAWWKTRPGAPVRCESSGEWLTAFDAENRRVWRHKLPEVPVSVTQVDENAAFDHPASFADLDGDGRVEALYVFQGTQSGVSSLRSIGEDGRLEWVREPGREVQTVDGNSISGYWIPSWVGVLSKPRADGGRIIYVSHHVYSWPSRVAALTAQGKVVAEYWFPGWLIIGFINDLDGDGVEEILVGGVNDSYSGRGHEGALVVLDAEFSSGQSAVPAGDRHQMANIPVVAETASLVLPKTSSAEMDKGIWPVKHIRREGDNLEVFEMGALGHPGMRSNVHYRLDLRLRMLGLTYDRSFEASFASGLPPAKDRTRQVEEALGRILVLRNRFAK